MKTLGIREVRQRYEVLKEMLEREGEVILTHHGKPFARVLPLTTLTQQQLRAHLVREDRDAR